MSSVGRWVTAALVLGGLSAGVSSTAYASWGTTLDPTFGVGATVTLPIAPGASDASASVAVQPNGDVLIGGSTRVSESAAPGQTAGLVARVLPGGAIDPAFGASGVVRLDGLGSVSQVASAPDGDVVALGNALVSISPDGTRDASFGSNGTAVLPSSFVATRFALQANRAIVLIGTSTPPGGIATPAVARLTPDGQPDPSFGTDGLVAIALVDQAGNSLSSIELQGVIAEPDGTTAITARGISTVLDPPYAPYTPWVSILEHLTATGTPDAGFGQHAETFIAGGNEWIGPSDALLSPDANIQVAIIAGDGMGFGAPIIGSISPDGASTGLGPGIGTVSFQPVGGFVALPDGGYLTINGGTSLMPAQLNITRFDAALQAYPMAPSDPPRQDFQDTAIGFQAPVTLPDHAKTTASLLAVQPDGKIIVAGTAPSAHDETTIMLARLFGINTQAFVGLPSQHIHHGAHTLTVRLTCGPAQRCHGRSDLLLPHQGHQPLLVIGRGTFSIPPGLSRNATITLTHAGRARLAGQRPLRLTLTLIPTNGPARSATIAVPDDG